MLRGGDTFQFANRALESHLWIIISDPENHPPDRVLIANLTSWRSDKEGVCVLRRGDHPFVKKKTVVNYRASKLARADQLEQLLARGALVPRHRVRAEVLQRIREGAALSRMIPLENLQLLKDQGLVE